MIKEVDIIQIVKTLRMIRRNLHIKGIINSKDERIALNKGLSVINLNDLEMRGI